VVGVACGAAAAAAGLFAWFAPKYALPDGQWSEYGYGEPLAVIGSGALGVIAAVAGAVLTLIASAIARR
jgi:hypothetical protein